MQTWNEWQNDVIALLNMLFKDILEQVSLADVDWPSWQPFYLEGRSPGAAISRALERDF